MDLDEIRNDLVKFTKGLVTNAEIVSRVNNMVSKYNLSSENLEFFINHTYCCDGDDWSTCGVIEALRESQNNL